MGSGVLWAIILSVWAIVLVPMLVNRADRRSEVREVARFQRAMGSLAETTDRIVAERARQRGNAGRVVPRQGGLSGPSAAGVRPRPARRRRAVTLVLLGVLALTSAAVLIWPVPWWVLIIGALPAVLWTGLAVVLAMAQRRLGAVPQPVRGAAAAPRRQVAGPSGHSSHGATLTRPVAEPVTVGSGAERSLPAYAEVPPLGRRGWQPRDGAQGDEGLSGQWSTAALQQLGRQADRVRPARPEVGRAAGANAGEGTGPGTRSGTGEDTLELPVVRVPTRERLAG